MKKYGLRVLALCLILCMLLGTAGAADLSALRKKLEAGISKGNSYDFGFHISDDGTTWGEWQRKTNGVNFRVKIENFSDCEYIDAFSLAISAKNVYEEPVMLKGSDGDWHDSLWYTSDITYKPGRVAMSEYFYVQGDQKIKYIEATVVKYHIKGGGTVEIDPFDYDSRTWTID